LNHLGLYLHIPFCGSICNYCNFTRGLFDGPLKTRYVEALTQEIARAADGSLADTIYFGGGTPSLLTPGDVERLIRACRDAFAVARGAEITLEANPEDATAAGLAGYHAAGVNRLSMGVQSLRDQELQRLGRRHSAARAREAFALARAAGFDNVSLDLMLWLPGQSIADSRASVDALAALGPDHASVYLLELYPNAPLRDEMARAGWSLAPDEDAADMYLAAMETLERADYLQYEISNVARAGRQARHNLKYWTDGEWLGFGCGAHSTRAGVRWKNCTATEDYVARLETGRDAVAERRVLDPAERLGEALFTGLRVADGVDLAAVGARYGVDVWARYGDALQPFVEEGLAVREGASLRLSRRGMLLANEIMAVFV
jgi:oxygen-independent coproporphyrinogen-3 oxidase